MLKSLIMGVLPLSFIFSTSYAAVDPDSLIKVDSEIKSKCVEYYYIKDDLYCSTTAQSAEPVDPKIKDDERLKIVFDDRPWFAAWGKKNSDMTMIEYIPAGDNINSWNELITSNFIHGNSENITPKQVADTFVDDIKKSGFNPIVTIHEEDQNHVLLEFKIEEPESQRQDELQLIRKGDDGYYILHYVIKKVDMGEENRKKWIDLLEKSTLPEN